MQTMYDWCVRLTSLILICWRVNEREEGQINVASLQVTDRRLFCRNCIKRNNSKSMCDNYYATCIFCKFVQAWSHWSIQKRNAEAQKAKRLFIPLNIILPEAELEEKKKSSFLLFVHFCLSFFGWHFRGT